MKQPELDRRHRDKNGEISRKHGNALIGTLRKQYGAMFAKGYTDQERLGDVLHKLDDHSLSELVRSTSQSNKRTSAPKVGQHGIEKPVVIGVCKDPCAVPSFV